MATYAKGDLFIWTVGTRNDSVSVKITRVAKDQTWADILCWGGRGVWTKRQPLPLPDTFHRLDYTDPT